MAGLVDTVSTMLTSASSHDTPTRIQLNADMVELQADSRPVAFGGYCDLFKGRLRDTPGTELAMKRPRLLMDDAKGAKVIVVRSNHAPFCLYNLLISLRPFRSYRRVLIEQFVKAQDAGTTSKL